MSKSKLLVRRHSKVLKRLVDSFLNKQVGIGSYILYALAVSVDELSSERLLLPGMLGIHFPSDRESMISQIPASVSVFGHALDALMSSDDLSDDEKRSVVQSNVSCQSKDEIR